MKSLIRRLAALLVMVSYFFPWITSPAAEGEELPYTGFGLIKFGYESFRRFGFEDTAAISLLAFLVLLGSLLLLIFPRDAGLVLVLFLSGFLLYYFYLEPVLASLRSYGLYLLTAGVTLYALSYFVKDKS